MQIKDHYLIKSIKNKTDCCSVDEIEFFYNMAHLDVEMARFGCAHVDKL